jgi:uncharacterized protein YcgI (DUF1989 family)
MPNLQSQNLDDGLSNGRTFDYGETLRLSTGSVLYSRRSRPLLRIVADDVGVHDFLYAPCSQEMYEIGYGATSPHPNCLDNLTHSLARFAVPAATVTIAFNVFMRVDIGPGRTRPVGGRHGLPGGQGQWRTDPPARCRDRHACLTAACGSVQRPCR